MLAVAKVKPAVGIELIDAEYPQALPDEVVVKIKACGICGSDVQQYLWTEYVARLFGSRLPYVLGHEVCGEIIATGQNVKGFEVRERVSMEPVVPCGNCYLCKSGRSNLCVNYSFPRNGGMAEYMPIPASALVKVPDNLPDIEVPLIETLGAGLHGLEQMPVLPGNSVAVIGAGPIGLLLMQCIKASGAWPLVVTGTSRSKRRLELARELGADVTIVADREDVVAKVKQLTNNRGVDQVFEAAGTGKAMLQAIDIVKVGGQICVVGATDDPIELKLFTMLRSRGVNLITSIKRTSETWERAINLVRSGKVRLSPIISEVLPLKDALRGFELLLSNRDYIKVVLAP